MREVLQPGFDGGRRKVVVYYRVSSPVQKPDLASQVRVMQQFCLARGLGRGRGEVGRLVVRTRAGWSGSVSTSGARGGCEIVANQESLSAQQEVVEDLLAIVHSFSWRLDRLRRYEKELEGADGTVGDDQ